MLPSHRFFLGGPLTGKTHCLTQAYLACPSSHPPLFLSFYDANAEAVQQTLSATTDGALPWVTTMQRFIFRLLREYHQEADLPPDVRTVSALARSLIIRQAWAAAGGALWRAHRETPGATEEVTRIIDWLSANRTAFDVQPGELADHDLCRLYARYIALCREHRLLTFQEASLRAIPLLRRPDIAAEMRRRFSAVLVDDLHQARPDQLAALEALCMAGLPCTGAGWVHDRHADPALDRVRAFIERMDGDIERLSGSPPGVNPAIYRAANRLTAADLPVEDPASPPVTLIAGETVEDETQAVARFIREVLEEDASLRPEDILVIGADAEHLRFMHRQIERAGLPVATPASSPRQNPYIRAGMWIAQWHARGPRTELLHRLIRLPLCALDPMDLDRLETAARALGQSLLDLSEADWPDDLRYPNETASAMSALRQALAPAPRTASFAGRLDEAVHRLEQPAALQPFLPAAVDSWRAAFAAWVDQIREMEAAIEQLGLRPREVWPLIDRLADQMPASISPQGVRVIDAQQVEGFRCRVACVAGLSEHVMPRMESVPQILDEAAWPALFADGRPATRPAYREHGLWMERASRRLAVWMSRGCDRLALSVSRYTAAGNAQLPSPFFEGLLGEDGEIDRDGRLRVASSRLWRLLSAPRAVVGGLVGSAAGDPIDPPAPDMPEQVVRSPIYSASQIRTYLRCPLQFFYDRVLHLDSDETPSVMRRGALLHLALCAALGDGRTTDVDLRDAGRPPWLDDAGWLARRALAALNAAWTGEAADLPGGGALTPEEPWAPHFGPALQRNAVHRWAGRVLRQWAEFEADGRQDALERRPVLLETPFSFTIGPYFMIGRIDRIDEVVMDGETAYEVIDYKTGSAGAESTAAQIKKFLPEGDGDTPTDYQLPIYALALQEGLAGIRTTPRLLTYINLDRLEKTTRGTFVAEASRSVRLVARDTLDPRRGILPEALLNGPILDRLRGVMDAMSASPYPATPGFHCNFCGFRSACSRGQSYGE